MPAITGVKRGYPHQAVHARFGFQITIGVIALNLDSDAFDTGLVALLQVHNCAFHTTAPGPARIEPHQHSRPVGRVSTAGTRVDHENRVLRIVRVVEHRAKFEPTDPLG